MKVIFLDIDGVLNHHAYDRKRNWNEHQFWFRGRARSKDNRNTHQIE